MPIYIFESPTGEVKEVVQRMNEEHSYSEEGVQWSRLFTSPQAAQNTKLDPFSKSDFTSKVRDKKGTMGDLFDQSKEMSMKRREKIGVDPVKQKYWENWSKKRKGRRPPPSSMD